MKYYALSYCTKVWLTSVLLAPIILISIDYSFFLSPGYSSDSKSPGFGLSDIGLLIQVYLTLILVGAILSFIIFLVFWAIGYLTYRNTVNVTHRKLIMSLAGCILTILPFALIFSPGDEFIGFPLAIMGIYSVTIMAGSLIYCFD